jgi:UDP-3-O-[3-hydroxymyristoyl] glucosamine N-acyltransferase
MSNMTTTYTLAELAARFGGRVLGDDATRVSQVATLERAGKGQIAFLANSKYRSQLATTQAGALILGEADAEASTLPRIISDNPYVCFAKVSTLLNPPPAMPPGIHPSAVIGLGAKIAASVHIGPHVTIGAGAMIGADSVILEGCSIGPRVMIGERAWLHPRVVICHDCIIGNRFIAHSGAVIGADGFGLAMEKGRWLKIPQIGRVVIGDDVDIGANTTVDRGALDDTVIEEGVKLDNHIQIGHNVRIGAYTAMAAMVGVSGSTSIGRACLIGGKVGISGHLQITDNVELLASTQVTKSIREPGTYAGPYPFAKQADWARNTVHVRHLDALTRKVKELQQQLAALKPEN